MMRVLSGKLSMATALVAFLALEGCATYHEQKADALTGGPERRLQQAEERRQAAEDRRIGLESDQDDLQEEIAQQEEQLADLDNRIDEQNRRLDRARAENRLSRNQEKRMRREFTELQDALLDLQFRFDVANATGGSTSERAALQEKYEALSQDVKTREAELELLLQE
jgi:chromosome segregation ATPase